jgi:hypothetical protein
VKPGRAAHLVVGWVRLYTRGLPAATAERRLEEIEADLHDHVECERDVGTGDRRVALGILSRMLRGVVADAAWRADLVRPRTAYRSAMAMTIGTPLFLLWLMGAVGVIGVEGDPADLMYLGVLAVGAVGALIARFRPRGMARALVATAGAQALVAAIVLVAGKHEAPISSVFEILGLNGMFIALFLGAARLFRHAAGRRPPTDTERER